MQGVVNKCFVINVEVKLLIMQNFAPRENDFFGSISSID